jgi:hypothetical protein
MPMQGVVTRAKHIRRWLVWLVTPRLHHMAKAIDLRRAEMRQDPAAAAAM